MVSSFSWLDVDDEQRRKMLQVVDYFKEDGTVDELGIGSIRDTISDLLFPGTSVLHTRLRYFLLIPWAMREVALSGSSGEAALAQLRQAEIRTIYALLRSEDSSGTIGQQSKDKLKRMPSAAYWAALRSYGLVTLNTSPGGWFRQATVQPADGPSENAPHKALVRGLHPDLPLAPDGWRQEVGFTLTAKEQAFLRERIQRTSAGSLLEWLATRPKDNDVEYVWRHPSLLTFPGKLQQVIDHGRRVHIVAYGAALLYNLMLAEQVENDEYFNGYREALAEWREELAAANALQAWDRHQLWDLMRETGRNPAGGVRTFLEGWINMLESGEPVEDDPWARRHVRDREIRLKASRSRFTNAAARNAWSGGSGLVRLDYRWSVTRRLLADLHGQEVAA